MSRRSGTSASRAACSGVMSSHLTNNRASNAQNASPVAKYSVGIAATVPRSARRIITTSASGPLLYRQITRPAGEGLTGADLALRIGPITHVLHEAAIRYDPTKRNPGGG